MPTTTNQIPELTEKDKFRFWKKINKDGGKQPHMETPCWEWTASKASFGILYLEHKR